MPRKFSLPIYAIWLKRVVIDDLWIHTSLSEGGMRARRKIKRLVDYREPVMALARTCRCTTASMDDTTQAVLA
jgi:hypothetical protein